MKVIDSQAFLGLPVAWQIVFGIIIALCLIFAYLMKYKGFRTIMANSFKKMFHIAKQQPLLMHNLFFNKNYYYRMIYRMKFEMPEKTEIFIILTKNKVDVTIQLTKEFIKEHNRKLKDYSSQQLRDLLYNSRHRITKQSNQLSKTKFCELYGKDKGLKLWGLIYDSNNGYKKYWEAKNLYIDKNIERLISSESRNNEESLRSILTQIDISLDIAILDCEETFNGLNGQIAEFLKM